MGHRTSNQIAAARRAAVGIARKPSQRMRVFSLLAAMPGAGVQETIDGLIRVGVHDRTLIMHLDSLQRARLEQLLLAHPGSW